MNNQNITCWLKDRIAQAETDYLNQRCRVEARQRDLDVETKTLEEKSSFLNSLKELLRLSSK